MMKNISFLIGSGFSIPAGLPTTSDINSRMKKINESEICIHTSQEAWFLGEGETDPNAHLMNVEKRNFVQEFLEFYNNSVLEKNEQFHYEDFFDYYSDILNKGNIPKNLALFFKKFGATYNLKHVDDLLFNFNLTFNQLIQRLLQKPFESVSIGRPYHPNFSAFLELLDLLPEESIVHLHSLNHDLYLEYLSQSETLSNNFDDGFEEIGSPYYGRIYDTYVKYMVRLSRYINIYRSKFRLYKLHGSIDHYWFREGSKQELIKLKNAVNKINVFKEIYENNELKYYNSSVYFHPDFLSGTTSKIERYDKGDYYPIMFEYFKNNLNNSDILIIIGYGFGDRKINEIIEVNFDFKKNKKVFIVDIKKPSINWFESDSVFFIDGGVINMDINEIASNIG